MKKATLVIVFLLFATMLIVVGNATGMINATINGEQESTVLATSACWISDSVNGPTVRSVKQSSSAGEYMYWVHYSPGKVIYSLDFVFVYKGSHWPTKPPLTQQVQKFRWPSGYGGQTTTPFGVPWWGGDPIIGPAYVVPVVNGVYQWSNMFSFNVVR
jgi:hypothetical protein